MNPFSTIIRTIKHKAACRRLDKMVAQTREANAAYPKRRAAGQLGHARKRGLA